MGCFFACFRIKDVDHRKTRLVSNPFPSKGRDTVLSKKQLASVFLCEENGSPLEQAAGRSSQESGGGDGLDSELNHEAKFLKSIGTIPETPAEIQKASGKIIVQTTNEDGLSSNSWHPDKLHKKLDWDEQLGQISDSPAQVHESSGLREHMLESCNPKEHQPLRKAMWFDGNTDDSVVELFPEYASSDISPSQSGHIHQVVSNDSPYPTPVNLTDQMQTPGTVYPASLESPRTRKNARFRTQYVCPVLNPMDNLTQRKVPRESSGQLAQSNDLFEQHIRSCSPDSREKIGQIALTPVPMDSRFPDSLKLPCPTGKTNQNQEIDSKKESAQDQHSREQIYFNPDSPQYVVVSSLSQWLKPPLPKDERRNNMNAIDKRSPFGKSPDTDRPIIGLVAAHWNDDEPSHISQKWWDGNGIPNSTNKYKEDQKVSWHATPFEERLEKALSDEKLFPQSFRNLLNGKPIQFEDEGDESDTAAS